MPINSTHPNFSVKKSTVCNDAYNGDVLDYVPKLTKQTNEQYEAYRQRGVYFNVTKRTVEAMVGAALRKPFVTDMNNAYVDGDQTLHELTSDIIRGLLTDGRQGILVDYKDGSDTPYLCSYKHENIINWRNDRTLIVLSEMTFEENPKDPYELKEVVRYREMFIDEDGYYQVRIWREHGKNSYEVVEQYTPTRRGEPLTYIPFIFITPFDTSTNCYDPVVYNLSQINISHFKTVVDLEHGAHFTALPTPWYSGEFAEDMGGNVSLGGDFFLAFEPGASVGFLEFSGSGLKSLEVRRESKELQMATLGSQLMIKVGVESADAMKIRSAAETAALVNIVTATESAMQQALSIYKWWMTSGDNVEPAQFEMSRDFNASQLSPQEMIALMQLFMNGTISQETYLENLFEGEITQDVEEEMRRLNSSRVEQIQE